MDRVDLIGVMVGVVLEDEELGEIVGGVDDRTDGVGAGDADVAAVDALDGEQAAELGLELGALGGGEVFFQVEEDDVVEHRTARFGQVPPEGNSKVRGSKASLPQADRT